MKELFVYEDEKGNVLTPKAVEYMIESGYAVFKNYLNADKPKERITKPNRIRETLHV